MLVGPELIIALLIVFVGATVMGTVGFGLGLVVAPVLLFFLAPQQAVVTVNGIIAILVAIIVAQSRRHLDLRLVGGMTLGGMAAAPIGVLVLGSANPTALRLTIAAVILALGAMSLANIQLPLARRRFAGPFFGFLTALSITTLSIGGPLAAIYVIAQQWPPQVMRVSLAFFFLLTYTLAFILYSFTGLVQRETVLNIGILIPSLVGGFALASLLARHMDARVFRYVAIALIITGSVVLITREIVRL